MHPNSTTSPSAHVTGTEGTACAGNAQLDSSLQLDPNHLSLVAHLGEEECRCSRQEERIALRIEQNWEFMLSSKLRYRVLFEPGPVLRVGSHAFLLISTLQYRIGARRHVQQTGHSERRSICGTWGKRSKGELLSTL